ncbi:GNAT family N-acetyltransferase [Thiohalobacter thiocyanaticus]|uniref:tRNA(Met) cytidine acetyltransferase n=1 Tax=Thiohalobacter thiocyanaticus TaxID=585455 RepID=A0A426QKU7_9GAMM|nr:GNAT family N-acetyltransferase [Thiohalobacter thiocyanaticus]RRQ22404.1 tRNA(Met) cytidine acetyltransferase [Thiohalobacter thiocyanaticus]
MSTQDEAVAAILALARGQAHQPPLVLSAPRGRGKSAALGMAAAGLPDIRILVTAPRCDNCEALLRHARAQGAAAPRFVPPDELLRRQPPADLLLIDEAAAIPLPLLERLVQGWPRVALATTVQGYEGTGRGFELKFFPRLDRITPGWRLLRLHDPVRWAADDPLERWLGRALLLDADLLPPARLPAREAEAAVYARLDRDALLANEPELRQLFGLLVSAHYRTRPSDLRQLLDAPGLEIHVLRQGDSLLAAALTVPEGPLPADLIPAIFSGRRRLRGHLVAQSLVAHVGCEAAGRLRGRRIMRIAVHPRRQCRGLGSRLLRELEADARHRGGVDWLGASFGLDSLLLSFWRANGYVPLRLGLKREASSGLHAALLLKALGPEAQALVDGMSTRFQALLPLQLADGLERLEPELAQALLQRQDSPPPAASLTAQDWAELAAFAFGRRGYEVSLVAITRLLHRFEDAWMQSGLLDAADRDFLFGKCLQHRSWRQLVEAHRLDGAGAARERLRGIMRKLLCALAAGEIDAERERLSL